MQFNHFKLNKSLKDKLRDGSFKRLNSVCNEFPIFRSFTLLCILCSLHQDCYKIAALTSFWSLCIN